MTELAYAGVRFARHTGKPAAIANVLSVSPNEVCVTSRDDGLVKVTAMISGANLTSSQISAVNTYMGTLGGIAITVEEFTAEL
jgi:hypothetical protein